MNRPISQIKTLKVSNALLSNKSICAQYFREIEVKYRTMAEPDIMTWFPRKEDYEIAVSVLPDEKFHDKVVRYVK